MLRSSSGKCQKRKRSFFLRHSRMYVNFEEGLGGSGGVGVRYRIDGRSGRTKDRVRTGRDLQRHNGTVDRWTVQSFEAHTNRPEPVTRSSAGGNRDILCWGKPSRK